MKLDGSTLFALLLLLGPVTALGLRYKFEWGAGLGLASGVWRISSLTALVLLAGVVAATLLLGADEFRALMGSRSARSEVTFFLVPGAGLATAMFPGPASEFVGKYKILAATGSTRSYSIVGWTLFSAWAFLSLIGFISTM